MATISDNAWDVAVPADSEFIKNGPQMVRDAKNQLGYRIQQEHSEYSSGSPDYGGIHRKGSARVFTDNTIAELSDGTVKRPAHSADQTLAAAYDEGRLAIPTDGNDGLYYYNGDDSWDAVGIVGMAATVAEGDGTTLLGDQIALLPGRAGGQTLLGGTGDGDALNLGGSSHANEGPINIVAADTTLVNCNSVRLTSLGAPTTSGDALRKGDGSTAAELDSDDPAIEATNATNSKGGIAVAAHGSASSSASTLTADVGFAPDIVIGWNDKGTDRPRLWSSEHPTKTKLMGAGSFDTSGVPISVSGTTISFEDQAGKGVNDPTSTMYYFALKTNREVDPSA